ncbi:O-antigen ligase family protein [Tamlana sp. 62-3]|uniref:O-antigen ligase family protein n=1 Tax=Neotamlana sargassicola TaxID=2883125 RepID=A0A9X1L7N4_9FLAO|nr:O-antigen ligase family protein [Tamlana sargassicola]MCB4807933.1 O-antigen ligase family protein [Tamlana sargassicola]
MDLFKNYVLFYKGLLLTLFLLFLYLPSVNQTDYVNSTITSKTVFFLYALIVTLSCWGLQMVVNKNKQRAVKISILDVLLALLLVFICVNRYVLQSNYGFSIRFIELLGLSLLYVILRGLPVKHFVWILFAIVLSGVIQAGYGNFQLLGYYPSNHSGFKMTGSFFNPGPFAGLLTSVWTMALGLYLYREQIFKQFLYLSTSSTLRLNTLIKYTFEYILLLAIIGILLVVPASQSRASWLAIAITTVILLEFKYCYLKKLFAKISRFKKVMLSMGLLIVLGLSLFGIYHFKKGSSDGRLFIWKVSFEIIKENPVVGVGFDRFKAHYMDAQANYFAEHGETTEAMVADNSYYAFNEFVQFVVENGLVGLLSLIILSVLLFKTKVEKENTYISNILKTCLLAISVFACFSYPMQILPIKIILVAALAMLTTVNAKVYEIKITQSNTMHKVFKTSLLVIAIFGVTKASLYANVLNEGFKTWQYALSPYGSYEDVLEDYKAVYPLFKRDGDFLMNYGKTLCLEKKYPQAISILQQAKQHLNTTIIETALGDAYKGIKQYEKAEITYKKAYHMIPSRFYPLYLLANLYDESGDKTKAVTMAKRLLDKEVKIPSTAIKEMKTEMKRIITKHNTSSTDKKSQYK